MTMHDRSICSCSRRLYGCYNVVRLSCIFILLSVISLFFFFNDTSTTEIYTLSLHDALPILGHLGGDRGPPRARLPHHDRGRSEEHTSELQSPYDLVCRLLLEKKKRC